VDSITPKERETLRELAGRYMEIASDEVNDERRGRMKSINGLKPVRPPALIDEIPWHEMDIDGQLALVCENGAARQMEFFFRTMLYRWKYIQADMVAEGCYYVNKAFDATDIGVNVKEDILLTDSKNHIVSHRYEDRLDTYEKVEALRPQKVTARPEKDRESVDFASDILDGIMPVKLRGHGIYYAPWDIISMLRGVERVLLDMAEKPDLIHATMKKFKENGLSYYGQMEEQGLLDYNLSSLHCTPAYTDELPAKDYDGGKVRLKDVWFRGMAQMFSTVSPEMHEEFDLSYMRELMGKCGLSYYGCCEPLDAKLDLLFTVPNMRKLGVSPWSNVPLCAEKMGGRYVFARKPNPAFVSGSFDRETVKKEISETLRACVANKCPCELVLKDISTVTYKPQNLIEWNKTVQETIDEYYG